MDELTRHEVFEGCCKSDRVAQRRFYDFYKKKLLGICKRYVKNSIEAEDIFQESFIKIFQNIKTLRNIEMVDGWVRKIIINTAINHYTANLKYNDLEISDTVEIATSHDKEIIDQMSTESLLNEIQSMPDGYRLIFNLYVIDGYSHIEIANMLKISEGTSKSQLSKAKKQLRHHLQKTGIISYETY